MSNFHLSCCRCRMASEPGAAQAGRLSFSWCRRSRGGGRISCFPARSSQKFSVWLVCSPLGSACILWPPAWGAEKTFRVLGDPHTYLTPEGARKSLPPRRCLCSPFNKYLLSVYYVLGTGIQAISKFRCFYLPEYTRSIHSSHPHCQHGNPSHQHLVPGPPFFNLHSRISTSQPQSQSVLLSFLFNMEIRAPLREPSMSSCCTEHLTFQAPHDPYQPLQSHLHYPTFTPTSHNIGVTRVFLKKSKSFFPLHLLQFTRKVSIPTSPPLGGLRDYTSKAVLPTHPQLLQTWPCISVTASLFENMFLFPHMSSVSPAGL